MDLADVILVLGTVVKFLNNIKFTAKLKVIIAMELSSSNLNIQFITILTTHLPLSLVKFGFFQ